MEPLSILAMLRARSPLEPRRRVVTRRVYREVAPLYAVIVEGTLTLDLRTSPSGIGVRVRNPHVLSDGQLLGATPVSAQRFFRLDAQAATLEDALAATRVDLCEAWHTTYYLDDQLGLHLHRMHRAERAIRSMERTTRDRIADTRLVEQVCRTRRHHYYERQEIHTYTLGYHCSVRAVAGHRMRTT